MRIRLHTLLFTMATVAAATCFTACGSDSTSANENAGTYKEGSKTDTIYVNHLDTVYVAVTDSTAMPSAANISSESAKNASSSTVQPESSETIAATSSEVRPASSATQSSSATTTPSSNSSSSSLVSSATSANSAADSNPASSAANPNILWSDEFDGNALDKTKWGYNIGTGDNGWGNSEKEYYTDREENVYVKDGMLHIRAQKEDYEGSKYTSARLLSQNKFTFTYGTVEARIALPKGKGIWPAFWMLGESIDKVSWPACGEIDIIEAINDESIVYGTHHWAHNGEHANYGNSTADHHGASTTLDISEFHTYKMTWDKEFIRMYVDDFKYQEIDIKDTGSDMATFHKPFFFILNVAVGGTWPGFDIDDSQFPTEMKVDYIRVYKN